MMQSNENFSIIIPTYQEAHNILPLIERIAATHFGGRLFEVIIVDDHSNDGIETVIEELRLTYPWLKLEVRQAEKSLCASALLGFQKAQYPNLILMDADLSHPPEKIPAMLKALEEADFVIGSRYVDGGSTDSIWPIRRKMTSRVAAGLAQCLLRSAVKDPLSGFFAFHQKQFQSADTLNPIGWKIGLELMLKCRCRRIKEIPIHFSERLYGKSKLNLKVAMDYLRHISRLMRYKIFA